MSLAYLILIGFAVGVIARFVYPGRQAMSLRWTILLAAGGSLVAAWGARAPGSCQDGEPASVVASVLGAPVLLFVHHRAIAK